jgi:6-phosphogluconolactonase/glucosamine-6-phosphate isomerase/deaminase
MAMRFVKVDSAQPVAQQLAHTLHTHLQKGERVLWLISGGSVIKVATAAAAHLRGENLERLTVSLTDERPGPEGHPSSNWLGLMEAGFALPSAHLQPVLTGDGTKSETGAFNRFLHEQLERNDFKLGLFGIGPDGHTAGLPVTGAPPSDELADYYESDLFLQVAPAQRDRISMTPAAIEELDLAVAYVMGESKRPQLERLLEDLTYEQQSAQALKLARTLTVFNDQLGEPE